MLPRHVYALAPILCATFGGGCQSHSELDQPRPPRPVIEARTTGSTIARVVPGHPCRAEIEGNELLVGTEPLVAQVGSTRWSGEDGETGTTLRRDGSLMIRLHALPADGSLEVFDAHGGAILRISADGAVANARGEILRRAEPSPTAIKVGESIVTGTSDVVLGALVTAPELIPEIRALAACHRLVAREQAPVSTSPVVRK